MIWVSPTEPRSLRDIAGKVSMFPEEFGVDVLVAGKGETVGIQRKTVNDLLASLEDGRLTEQVVKMQRLDLAMVLVEGHVDFVNGHLLTDGWGRSWSRESWRRMLMTLRRSGVHVEYARDLEDTVRWVRVVETWCESEEHSALKVQGKRVQGSWGERTTEHYRVAMLASLPGVGEGLARRILDEVGWPFVLNVDLEQVKGLGAKKVESIRKVVE